MIQFALVFGFFVVGFSFMAACLHFSKFQGKGGCCGGDNIEGLDEGNDADACFTCPNRGSEDCAEVDVADLPSTPQSA
ncbi:hypothetical protein IIA29_01980 [candidate division KSB1 bacterium]|nr:hypothetical protein [candidate division KSB1 bacterium]